MVQGEPFLGRSILTPRQTTARPTDNWQPPRREDGPEHKLSDSALSPSEAQWDRTSVPPSGALAGTMPNRTQSQPSGKGKGPTTSLNNAAPLNRQVRRPPFPDRSPLSSASEREFLPKPRPLTSEGGSASNLARGTTEYYQAQADRVEEKRDADDASFVDSQSQAPSVADSLSQLGLSQELSQDTLRINRQHATPDGPSRALPVQSERRPSGSLLEAVAAKSTQHSQPTHRNTTPAHSAQQQQKRPAPQTPTSEEPPQKKKRAPGAGGPSASGQRAPPSPSASPAMSPAMSPTVPVKTKFGNFGPQRSAFALDEESSGAKNIDLLKANARLWKAGYRLARERVVVFELKHKK
jgi:hypothetical protein